MMDIPQFSGPHLYDSHRWAQRRIGLFGGSFNPPHPGHLHIAKIAQIQFNLDFVWWIVTPQNPLKSKSIISPYEKRFAAVDTMLRTHPRQIPTHLERDIQSRYTYETVEVLKTHFPKTDFIWICGMDNAYIFHRWDRWQDLLGIIPITFIARPPAQELVKQCPIRLYQRIPQKTQIRQHSIDLSKPGIYWVPGVKMLNISSTQIRKKQ